MGWGVGSKVKSNPRNHNTGRAAWELKLAGSERSFCSQGKVQRRAAPHSGLSRRQQCMPTKAREPLESPVGKGRRSRQTALEEEED